MKALLSRRRFEVVALCIALVFSAVHYFADDNPVDPGGTHGGSTAVLAFLQTFEGRFTDMKFRFRGPTKPHPDIAVVEVGEASAQRFGLWPWSRALVARAITNLHAAGVRAVGLDMIFTDEVPDSAAIAYQEAVKALDERVGQGAAFPVALASYREDLQKRASVSADRDLATALASAPEFVLGVAAYPEKDRRHFANKQAEYTELLRPHVLSNLYKPDSPGTFEVSSKLPGFHNASAQTWLRVFASAGQDIGHFNATPDEDGTIRRHALFARLDEPLGLVPSLALEVAARYYGATIEPVFDRDLNRLLGARLRGADGKVARFVPLQVTEPYALINHVGKGADVFPRIELADVVDGKFAPEAVRGKAVFIGVSLVGSFDQRVTPFAEIEPGVFTHASFISNIFTGDFLTRPLGMRFVEIALMVLISLGLSVVLPRVRFGWKLVAMVATAAGYLALDQYLFVGPKLQLATVLPLANIFTSAFGVIFLGYISVDREKAQLRTAFHHYLNESVMESMLKHPERLKLGGEKKEMTVLFSDIRGFTTLSERMAPEALVKFINSYLTPMTRIVFDEGGTLDKYIGDAVMAFWGAPLDQEDHAVRACRAATRFLEQLKELKDAWREQNLPEFDIGVGINSGPMIVGNMGSDIRFDYTVMGDSVNLASRLEGTNKEYETRILMSEATYLLAHDQVIARRLGAVRVKGKRKPVRIYELRGMGQPQGAERDAIATFEAAVDRFTEQKFDEAAALFAQVQQAWPGDPPCRRYLEEIAELKRTPPGPTWDGVYTATHK